MTQAGHNRGQSRQDYETPLVFIHAVERMFGPLHVDLAATEKNAKAKFCLTPEDDSLKQYWGVFSKQRCWLNPPYSSIGPWAQKCAMYPQLEILFLVPASVCSKWFLEHVYPYAETFLLFPRLSFDGKNPYPKDLILARYGTGAGGTFRPWYWWTT